MQQRTNIELFKLLVRSQGEKAKAKVSLGADVSLSMIEKLMADTYGRTPSQAVQKRLCEFFGVSREDLFPTVSAVKKRAAS